VLGRSATNYKESKMTQIIFFSIDRKIRENHFGGQKHCKQRDPYLFLENKYFLSHISQKSL
jgi:hypothetical protein